MPNGKELLQELQSLVSEPGKHIDEEAYRRLLLTAMIGVLTRLDEMADNPVVYFGSIIKKYPKVFWGLIVMIIAVFTFVNLRDVAYKFLDIPIWVPTVIPTVLP